MSTLEQRVTINPHHPTCRYPAGSHAGLDPERCCYCAARVRQDAALSGLNLGLSGARPGEDPLDFRYGRCGCS